MKILIIDNISKNINKVSELFTTDDEIVTIKFNEIESDQMYLDYDLIILSGGRPSKELSNTPQEKDHFLKLERKLLMNTDVPIIGICYGFKIINEAYDSKIEFEETIIKGLKPFKLQSNFWKGVNNDSLLCYEEHHYTTKRLGKDLVPLAISPRGIEIVRHKKKLLFGLQFHPEKYPENQYGDELFHFILNYIKTKKLNPISNS